MIEIQWLAADQQEAHTIAKVLVEKKLIACANLIPSVTSLYVWEGKLEKSNEVLCLFKTTDDRYHQVEELIASMCSYDVPAILKVPVDGYRPYHNWIKKVLTIPKQP